MFRRVVYSGIAGGLVLAAMGCGNPDTEQSSVSSTTGASQEVPATSAHHTGSAAPNSVAPVVATGAPPSSVTPSAAPPAAAPPVTSTTTPLNLAGPPVTNPIDVEYLDGMAVHLRTALLWADVVLSRAERRDLLDLATAVKQRTPDHLVHIRQLLGRDGQGIPPGHGGDQYGPAGLAILREDPTAKDDQLAKFIVMSFECAGTAGGHLSGLSDQRVKEFAARLTANQDDQLAKVTAINKQLTS